MMMALLVLYLRNIAFLLDRNELLWHFYLMIFYSLHTPTFYCVFMIARTAQNTLDDNNNY